MVLAATLTACGFNDTLTTRGFIKEGDQICIDTLVTTGNTFRTRPNLTDSEFLGDLAEAYREAGRRFRRLQLRSDDQGLRDKVAAGYESFSDRFRADARTTASGDTPRSKVDHVFSDVSRLQAEMKANGFQVCGGGGAPEEQRQ